MIALWVILFAFCLIIFRQVSLARKLTLPNGIKKRVRCLFTAISLVLLWMPGGAILLATFPIWILLWIATGFNVLDWWVDTLTKDI